MLLLVQAPFILLNLMRQLIFRPTQQRFLATKFTSRNAKDWKLKRALLRKEEPCRAKTLSNVKFRKDLLSEGTKTSERKVVFNFGTWLRHMKTKNFFSVSLSVSKPQLEAVSLLFSSNQALGQWDDRKSGCRTSGICALLCFFKQIPLVPRPLFRSSLLTGSLEQAIVLRHRFASFALV